MLSEQNIHDQFSFIRFSEIGSSPPKCGVTVQSFGVRWTWVQILTLLPTGCVTWDKLLNFSSCNIILILCMRKQRTSKNKLVVIHEEIHLAWLLQGMERYVPH